MSDLSNHEVAILLATRVEEYAQSDEELALCAEIPVAFAHETIRGLIAKDILEPIERYDGVLVYGYTGSYRAQAIYEEIHGGNYET